MIKRFLLLGAVILALVTCMSMGTDPNATQVDAFSDYSSWNKVNAEPVTGDTTGFLEKVHGGPTGFREVFINAVGKPTSDGKVDLPYPTGTILVKETYKSDNGAKGKLKDLTIMVKRDPGYDSDNGDWEYLMVTASLRIRSQGRINMCIDCHAAGVMDAYVFTSNR